MKSVVASIRDHAAGFFGQPFFAPSRGAAIRSFGDAVNAGGEGNQFSMHPEDFDLYEIGAFDSDTGVLEPCIVTKIAHGKDLKVK